MIRSLCQLLLHLFFSTVRVYNPERIPNSGAVLIVANHHSGLVDPAVLIATLPRTPRFLAKAVLWDVKYLPLRPLLSIARAIPVHRQKDGGGDNSSMFSATHEALQDGDAIALFGEGVSHDMPGLLDLRTGAARIALGVDGPVTIQPVGLIYDDRARYRSQVSVYVANHWRCSARSAETRTAMRSSRSPINSTSDSRMSPHRGTAGANTTTLELLLGSPLPNAPTSTTPTY